MNIEVCKTFWAEAQHSLPYHKGKCHKLHGHSYKIEMCFIGPVQETEADNPESGMVLDFAEISNLWKPLSDKLLDHNSLNDFMPNPTAELLCVWLVEYFEPMFLERNIFLNRVTVHETRNSSATWRRHEQ